MTDKAEIVEKTAVSALYFFKNYFGKNRWRIDENGV